MPDIFTYFGFIFSFYSNEHEPIHVHVEHQNKMSIYDIIVCNGELIEIRQRDKGNPYASGRYARTAPGLFVCTIF